MLTGTVVIPGMGKKEVYIRTNNGTQEGKPRGVLKDPILEKPVINCPIGPIGPIGWQPIGPRAPIADTRPVISHPIVPIGHGPIVRPIGPMLTPEEASDVKKNDFFTKVFETHKRRVDKFKPPIVGK